MSIPPHLTRIINYIGRQGATTASAMGSIGTLQAERIGLIVFVLV